MDVPAPLAAVVTRWCEAWNRGDGAGLAALFADNSDFVNVSGAWTKTRANHQAAYTRAFAGPLRGTKLQGRIEALRRLRDDTVIMHVRWVMSGTAVTERAPGTAMHSLAILVVTREGAQWLVRAAQISAVA